jgi:hypothetical protein
MITGACSLGVPLLCQMNSVKSSGYPVVSLWGELSRDEFVQPLGIWLNPPRFFPFLPCVEIGRVAHHDQPDAMVASDVASLIDRELDRFFLIVGDVEDHVGVRGASQVR